MTVAAWTVFAIVVFQINLMMTRDIHQDSSQYLFRKSKHFAKNVNKSECVCPPNYECERDLKLEENAISLMKKRGIFKGDEEVVLRKYIDIEKEKAETKLKTKSKRFKRTTDTQCCCLRKNILLPSFITKKRYAEQIKRIRKIVENRMPDGDQMKY